MQDIENIKVGISIGDPNGIGGEVALKCFADERMLELCTPVFFCSLGLLEFYNHTFNLDVKFHTLSTLEDIKHQSINVLPPGDASEGFKVAWGTVDPLAGLVAVASLKEATGALKIGRIDVLVTAPINKESIQSDDFNFPGHTNYLNQELEGNSLMFMIAQQLRIGLITDHIPLKDVSEHVTSKAIKTKIGSIKESLKRDFGITRPRIAVLGINPHVGDNGVIGTEDQDTLIPTLEDLREDGTLIYGPYAADAFFGQRNDRNFDAVLASYHDQGLVPFKTLSFGNGVNYTAGLNKVRTSPDHGTGFDIAGTDVARPDSFRAAVFLAIEIYKARASYTELTANPLKTNSRKRSSNRRSRED